MHSTQVLLSAAKSLRENKITVCADIAKMYRHIWVSEEQRPLQRILWRNELNEKVEIYKLITVTFVLASSLFWRSDV